MLYHAYEIVTDGAYEMHVDRSKSVVEDRMQSILKDTDSDEILCHRVGTVDASSVPNALNKIRADLWDFTDQN